MKPSDFFLGVVNFLGVLVPGAILLSLRGWPFGSIRDVPVPGWLMFGGASYVIGQLLLAVTEILNDVVRSRRCPLWRTVYRDVRIFRIQAAKRLKLICFGSGQARFHTALSYIRTQNPAAAAEVDHHMADYKLLRSLLAVLSIDLGARAVVGPRDASILVLEALSIGACFLSFARMFNWAQLLSFQYVCLIKDNATATKTERQDSR